MAFQYTQSIEESRERFVKSGLRLEGNEESRKRFVKSGLQLEANENEKMCTGWEQRTQP